MDKDRIKNTLRVVNSFLRKSWFILFVIATYLFFTVYYMGISQTLLDCGHTLNGLGDNTAGPIWREANASEEPIGGFSKVTNYPSGESLDTPIDTVVAGQTLLLWTTAKIAGPVCGYNIMNVLGYVSAALLMFGFIYSLTKGRRWIALLAGYAVAFTPFFQAKIGGHPSYGFQALLIGIIWTFFSLVTTRKVSRAILLALLVAVCFYFDPYFSLMSVTILLPLCLVWVVIRLTQLKKRKLKKSLFVSEVKVVAVSASLLAILLIPVAYIMTTQATEIKMATEGTRGNIREEARVYSNMPSEYLLPFKDSPLLKLFGSYEQQVRTSFYVFSNGNISEDSVGLSLVMVIVVGLFAMIAAWEKIQGRKINTRKLTRYETRLVTFGVLAVLITAILLALPPVHIFGIPLPSYILLKLTSIWRVLSREYVVVNIAMTILFVISLLYFSHALRMKKAMKTVVYIGLFLGIFAQYQTYGPFQGLESAKFSYKNAPAGYSWLKKQSDIKAVVEYPIERATEANSHGYYLSMQMVHKKALLNSAVTNGPDESIRSSIKNLSDPQTIPTLHALGINAVVVHGVDAADLAKIPYLTVIYQGTHGYDAGLPGSFAVTKDAFVVARVNGNTPLPETSLQFLTTPRLNSVIQTSAIDWQYEVPSGLKLALRRLPPDKEGNVVEGQLCFMAKMATPGDSSTVSLTSTNGTRITATLTDRYQAIRMMTDTKQQLKLESANGQLIHITAIGCK